MAVGTAILRVVTLVPLAVVSIGVEVACALVWGSMASDIMYEFIAFAACTVSAVGMIAWCCCLGGAKPPHVGLSASAVALFMVLTFGCAVNVDHALYVSAMLFVPTAVAALSLCCERRNTFLALALGLGMSLLAALGTGAAADVRALFALDTATAMTAALCMIFTALTWATIQLSRDRNGAAFDSSRFMLAAVFRAALLVAAVFLAAEVLRHVSGSVDGEKWADELSAHSPHVGVALGDVEDAIITEGSCLRLPLGEPFCIDLEANGTASCIRLGMAVQYCPSTHTVLQAMATVALVAGFVVVTYVRVLTISQLGAQSQASACLLARLCWMFLDAEGLINSDEDNGRVTLSPTACALCAAAATAAVVQILSAIAHGARDVGVAEGRDVSEQLRGPGPPPVPDRRPLQARASAPTRDDIESLDDEMFKRWRHLRDMHEYREFLEARTGAVHPRQPLAHAPRPALLHGPPQVAERPPGYDVALRERSRSQGDQQPWFTVVSGGSGDGDAFSQHVCARCGFIGRSLHDIQDHVANACLRPEAPARGGGGSGGSGGHHAFRLL